MAELAAITQLLQSMQTMQQQQNALLEQYRERTAAELAVLREQAASEHAALEASNSRAARRPGVVDVKAIGKPDTLHGSPEQVRKEWPTWSYKFAVWFSSQFHKGAEILDWAKEQNDPITEESIDLDHPDQEEYKDANNQLHVALVNLTKDEPLDIVRNSAKHMGLDAWRRLCREYNPNNPQSNMRLLKKILHTQTTELDKLKAAIETWESNYSMYKERTRESLTDAMQRMCLIGLCPERLRDHLELQCDRLDSYQACRGEVVRYIENIQSRMSDSGASPLELDALYQRKGQGKGKAKGKGCSNSVKAGKDKGKGKHAGNLSSSKGGKDASTSQPMNWCRNCAAYVRHSESNCWWKKPDNASKG